MIKYNIIDWNHFIFIFYNIIDVNYPFGIKLSNLIIKLLITLI